MRFCRSRRSSFGNCTSLRPIPNHHRNHQTQRRSSFGNCTSLRHDALSEPGGVPASQFLRELHFIEAFPAWLLGGT